MAFGKLSLGAFKATSCQSEAYSRKIDGWQGSIESLHPFDDAAYAISYANMMLSSPIWSFLIQFDGIWYYRVWCYLRISMMRTMRTPRFCCPHTFLSDLAVHAASNEQTGHQGTSKGPPFYQWTNSWIYLIDLITSSTKSIYSTCAQKGAISCFPHFSSITVFTYETEKRSILTLPRDLGFQPWSTP